MYFERIKQRTVSYTCVEYSELGQQKSFEIRAKSDYK